MSQKKAVVLRKKVQAELAEALMDKLSTAERDPEQVLKSLTTDVRKRVEKLQEIQKKHNDLKENLIKEKEELDAKYEKLYKPLYEERFDIVNGVVEVKGVRDSEEEGVPEFWLTVLKANAVLAHQITKRDEEALKYLKDIKCSVIKEPKGFKLEFFFGTNPYFSNAFLTKKYCMVEDDEPATEKVKGTQIKWYPGKDLTKKISERNSIRGGKYEKPNKICDSFFNFFDAEGLKDIEEIDEEEAEEIQILLQQDYEIGCMIRDDIIPHAVSWFTGEATNNDDEDIAPDDDADEDEATDDEEDDEY